MMYKVISIISYIMSGFSFLLGLVTLFFSIPAAIFFILLGVGCIKLGKYSWTYEDPKQKTQTRTASTSLSVDSSSKDIAAVNDHDTQVKTSIPPVPDAALGVKKDCESVENPAVNSVEEPVPQPVVKKFTPLPDVFCCMKKKYEYTHVGIYSPDECIHDYEVNTSVKFIQESNNEYDHNAIAVYQHDIKIGYINRGKIQDMINDYINRNDTVLGSFDTPSTLCISFFRDLDKMTSEYNCYSYPLTSFAKKDIFDVKRSHNLSLRTEGDAVDLEYDYETERFIAYSGGFEIGEINTANSEKILSLISETDYVCTIKSLELEDCTSCKINLFIEK